MFDSPLDPADGGAELHSELHEAVPAFSDDEDTEDFEPRIITDPNLKPKLDLQENKKQKYVFGLKLMQRFWLTLCF